MAITMNHPKTYGKQAKFEKGLELPIRLYKTLTIRGSHSLVLKALAHVVNGVSLNFVDDSRSIHIHIP